MDASDRLERTAPAGPSARVSATVVAGVLCAVVGAGLLSRPASGDAERPSLAGRAPPTATEAPRTADSEAVAGDFVFQSLRVVTPGASTDVVDDGSIRIAARGAHAETYLRAAVVAHGSELGVATLQSDVRGVVEGRLGLVPIAETTTARLLLHEALSGYFLAEVPFTLQPGPPVSLLAPSPSSGPVRPDRIWIFGAALPQIENVNIRVRLPDSSIVLERTVRATPSSMGLRAFSAELSVRVEPQWRLLWLDVSWEDPRPESGPQSVRVPIHLRSPTDHHPAARPRGPTPP